ncbi:MAG: hypothetical protein LQ350_006212 [Teloschistes chrysophthalmus]|nr:MAG: hypothetical protein LQ350_006212 [Niorma chrysophthalma]
MARKTAMDLEDAVDATIMDLPARTRAKTKEVRQNAIEAGIVAPAESSKTIAASAAGKAASEADSDVFEEDEGLQDFGGTGVDNRAWNAWEKAQGKLYSVLNMSKEGAIIANSTSPIDDYLRQLQAKPRRTLRVLRPFMADLHYRYDDADDAESPRTYVVQGKHWQDFDTMITALMDQGKGRDMAYLKIEVPLEAFTPSTERYRRGDVQLQTHRLQLKPQPYHGQFDNRGVYHVSLSKNFEDVSSDVWRAIMKDYEIETRPHGKEEESVTVNEEIPTSSQASSTLAPGESSGIESSPAPPTPTKPGTPAPRSTAQPKGTKPRPIRAAKSVAQRRIKVQTPVKPTIVSNTTPRFTEKELVKVLVPGEAVNFSPNHIGRYPSSSFTPPSNFLHTPSPPQKQPNRTRQPKKS